METKVFFVCVLATTLSLTFGSPVQRNQYQPNYDNVPQCMQPSVSGMCLAYFPSYYYNPSKNTCESFIYGGCGGNANRFFSFEECMTTCGGFQPETQNFTLILESEVEESEPLVEESDAKENEPQVVEESDPCTLPSVSGPCRARLPRFYFNGNVCEEFIYGGCQANANNFKSIEECQQRCGPKSSEEVESRSEEKTDEVSNEQSE